MVYGFLTTAPNAIVEPIHPKAMPVILTGAHATRSGLRDGLVALKAMAKRDFRRGLEGRNRRVGGVILEFSVCALDLVSPVVTD